MMMKVECLLSSRRFSGSGPAAPTMVIRACVQAIAVRDGWIQAGDADLGSRSRDYGLWLPTSATRPANIAGDSN
jgi:hypothetical protein